MILMTQVILKNDHEDSEVCTDYIVAESRTYNMTVYEAFQKYFSSNEFRVNETVYDRKGVKNDVEGFLEQDYADFGSSNLGHRIAEPENVAEINVTSDGEYIGTRRPQDVDVSGWDRYDREIPVSDGQIEFTLWVGRQ